MMKIGTATLLQPRVYAYDPAVNTTCDVAPGDKQPEVRAEPGTFDLFQLGPDEFAWLMPVRKSNYQVSTESMGDGMVLVFTGDLPVGEEFECLSKTLTADDIRELHHNSGRFTFDIPSGAIAL